MAPISTKKRSREDDDFVLTLSDDENPVDVGESEEEVDGDEFSNKPATKTSGTKRKREANDAATGKAQQKKQKKQKRKQGGKGANDGEDEEVDEEEEEEDNALAGAEDDGALNPDFEFDVAGASNRGVVEDFDGWVMDGVKKSGGDKKGVDIDAIIERRRERKKDAEERKKRKEQKKKENGEWDPEASGSEGESANAGEDEEDEDAESVNFEDDELLAEDGFGMGAGDAKESDDEDEEDKGSGSDSEDGKEDGDDDDDDEDAASDNDSIASPVAHPDDEASDSDDESVDEEEAEKRKAFFAPEEKSTDKSDDNAKGSFQDYNLSRPILRGLAAVGFSTPTPIQRKTIPVALLGKDIVGGAVTGSGKTGAFIIPILERLLYRPRKIPTSRVAILMPTRELAVQCYNVATKLATFTDITFCQLVGGFSLREQENVLKKRPDVIIATPGRFIDHMRNSASFTVDTLEILVLDEADRMLEDGFAHELNEILTTIPKSRQTMLFSATMTDTVDKLIRVGLNRPVRLMVDSKKSTVTTLVQEFVRLRPGREGMRLGYLMYLCEEIYTGRVIIFFRQKREAHRVRIVFGLLGLKAAELHGSMTQEQRIKSVEDFREGRVAFLLATDVASRGLDIKGVETVINYEAPQSHEIYLHRVGRTARAGRSGRACTIAAEPDRKVVKQAVKASKAQGAKVVSRVVEPAVADSWAKKVEALAEEVDEILKEEKQEKQLSQAEMQVNKGENMLKHEREIMSRPKRTWFETERDKQMAKKAALLELNGEAGSKKKKVKLSNKDKKKLDASRDRHEGRVWKKGRAEREAPQKRPKKAGAKKGKKGKK
ncbi:hypothetical protein DTO271D3_9107 [Paecilomyces variotii]|nr:hypothetical protein DTO169C6_6326 [Paecilomyces variotii]KAJ9310628.1 hypothetical protein DTO271D3_9107 [Paecilomyces variotii]KAJ9352593.1 hypothetical protein DTO280E4_7715 [Paecilomyces variotii]KAJ9382153.1 hypothetical protein DTO063F5_5852 [Paecilomyces variotii]KAJ9404904.1 hypothetical protein DTO045G8_7368 [Paecilomyces variotii]